MKFDETGLNFYAADDVQSINGDGTVPIVSANIGGRMNSDRVFYVTDEHSNLPSNDAVIAKIFYILQNNPSKVINGIHSQPVNSNNLKLTIDCPVEIDKTAPEATISYKQDTDNPDLYTVNIKANDTISGIRSTVLKVNDTVIPPGANVFFNQNINTISLECTDYAGNVTTEQLIASK